MRVMLVVPTSRRIAPETPMMSGMRKLPPISMSCPREMTSSLPGASARRAITVAEVVISRGQLIEIGGSFRIPDIMGVSGAVLREVGTTNITRLADYERAVGPDTAALMQVHCSNYRITGFTKSVALPDLAALAKKRGLLLIDDIGSGALLDFGRFGFTGE